MHQGIFAAIGTIADTDIRTAASPQNRRILRVVMTLIRHTCHEFRGRLPSANTLWYMALPPAAHHGHHMKFQTPHLMFTRFASHRSKRHDSSRIAGITASVAARDQIAKLGLLRWRGISPECSSSHSSTLKATDQRHRCAFATTADLKALVRLADDYAGQQI